MISSADEAALLRADRRRYWLSGAVGGLLAFVVALVATTRLAWRMRVMARGTEPVRRGETWLVGAFVFLIGAGSCLVFFSSRLLVFHEAGIWGVALALAAFEWLIAYVSSE